MRRVLSTVAAVAALAVLFHSVWLDVPRSLRAMRYQHTRFAPFSDRERQQSFGALLPLRMDVYDFYRAHLRPGDRYWMQVKNSPFSAFGDKRTSVTGVAGLYLLPAIPVASMKDADVILSWDADPGVLPLRYSEQYRASLQLLFVSRVRDDG